jgi:type I restriction enzyme S subunit
MGGDGWPSKNFGDCALLVRDSVSPVDAKGLPYVGLEHIGEGRLALIGIGTAEDVTSLKSRFCKGDILFGKLRPYFRKVILAPCDGVCSTDIWVVRPKDNIDARFLFYWMASKDFIDAATRGSEGTKMPRAQWEFVSRLVLQVPPLRYQQAIACILGALDDKIELNRRMNRTLEATARAIFKSWFVDFDPVHWNSARRLANIPRSEPGKWFIYAIECEGGSHYIGFTDDLHRRFDEHCRGCGADWTKAHPPVRLAYWEPVDSQAEAVAREQKLKSGSGREWLKAEIARNWTPRRPLPAGRQVKPEIAALFPDTFEDSELGEIPKGWRIGPIGQMVQVLGGGTPSTKEPAYWEGGIHPLCTPKDMSSLAAPVLLATERHLTDEGLAKVSSGQLPVGTVLLSSRAPIGYLAIAETPVSVNQGIIAMVCDGELPNLYVLHWTRANMDRVLANANGSTFMEISKRNFRPITAVVPSRAVLRCFMQIVEPMHQRIVSSLKQIQHLSALRDTLLPKLISGELVVAEAERIAGRCL